MGLRPRAVTRDLEWGINVPLEGDEWMENASMYGLKRFKDTLHAHKYGRIHTQTNPLGKIGGLRMMRKINGCHYYFLGKDNVPFHTVIWPAILINFKPCKKW